MRTQDPVAAIGLLLALLLSGLAGCGGRQAPPNGEVERESAPPDICTSQFAYRPHFSVSAPSSMPELLPQPPPPWVDSARCELRPAQGPRQSGLSRHPVFEATVLAENGSRRLVAAVYWRLDALEWAVGPRIPAPAERPEWLVPEVSAATGHDLLRMLEDVPQTELDSLFAQLVGEYLLLPPQLRRDVVGCPMRRDELRLDLIVVEGDGSASVVNRVVLADDLSRTPFGGGRYWVGDLDADSRDEALIEIRMGENTNCRRDDMKVMRSVVVVDLETLSPQFHSRTRCIHSFPLSQGGRSGSGQISLFRRDLNAQDGADVVEGLTSFEGCLLRDGRVVRDFSHRCDASLSGRRWHYDPQSDRWHSQWIDSDEAVSRLRCEHMEWQPPPSPIHDTAAAPQSIGANGSQRVDLPELPIYVDESQIATQTQRRAFGDSRRAVRDAFRAAEYLYATQPPVPAPGLTPIPPFQGPIDSHPQGSGEHPGFARVFTGASVRLDPATEVIVVVHDTNFIYSWLFDEISARPSVPAWFPPESEWEDLRDDADGSDVADALRSQPTDEVFAELVAAATDDSQAYSLESSNEFIFGNELQLTIIEVAAGDRPRVVARHELSNEMYGMRGVHFWMGDIDHDGQPEVLVQAYFDGEPRCVLGEPDIEAIAIVDLSRRSPQLITQSGCWLGSSAEVSSFRPEADDSRVLVEVITSSTGRGCRNRAEGSSSSDEDCQATTMERRWQYDPASDAWTPSWTDAPDEGFTHLCDRDYCMYGP